MGASDKSEKYALEKYIEYIIELENDWSTSAIIPMFKIETLLSDAQAKEIGKRLYRIRTIGFSKNMTQKDLAERIGMQRTIVSRMERGDKKALNHVYLYHTTPSLNFPLDWLVFGKNGTFSAVLESTMAIAETAREIVDEINECFNTGLYHDKSIELDKLNNELKDILSRIKAMDRAKAAIQKTKDKK